MQQSLFTVDGNAVMAKNSPESKANNNYNNRIELHKGRHGDGNNDGNFLDTVPGHIIKIRVKHDHDAPTDVLMVPLPLMLPLH